MTKIPDENRKALLSKYTSKQNKLYLITCYQLKSWYIEWKWAGEPFKSRMLFKFSENDSWIEAKSFEEDLWPTYKFDDERKKK